MKKSKKRVLGVFHDCFEAYTRHYEKTRGPQAVKGGTTRPLFETYTRYFGVNDEEQEKKVLGVLNGSFLRNLVAGGHNFI